MAERLAFGLVPGACHGAWCLEPLERELRARGHDVARADLPIGDTAAGLARYAEVADTATSGLRGELVLVGHSLGAIPAAIVAGRRAARALVLVCGRIGAPGRPMVDRQPGEPRPSGPGWRVEGREDGTVVMAPDVALEALYHDCDPDTARWAAERLAPQAALPFLEPVPLERWPDLPTTYVAARADRVLAPDWQRWAARELLGREAVEIDGGHSPFLARPAALADVLVELALAAR